MKICLLIGEFSIFSGTSKPVFELAKCLSKKGHDVSIITSKLRSNLKEAHDLSFKMKGYKNLRIIEVPTNIYSFMIQGYKKDKDGIMDTIADADIIHGFNFLELYFTKRLLNKLKLDSKTVCSSSGPYKFYIKDFIDSGIISFLNIAKIPFIFKLLIPEMFLKGIFDNFDGLISNSEFIAQNMESLGINPEKIKKIDVILNIDQIDNYNKSKREKKYDFIYFGSGSSIRGVQDVLKAFEIVLGQKKDSTLAFYLLGSHGIEEKFYIYLIKSHKSFGSSIFLNLGAKLDILNIIKSSNAVILPFRSSIGYSHPPLTLIESMVLEKPVISTYVGSVPEFIQDEFTGFLVPGGDVKKIAEKMILTFDEDLRIEMGKNARKYVLEVYNTDKLIMEIINLYNKVISEDT